MYPAECDEEALEDASVLFKYNESATGVWMVYREPVHALELTLSPWASDADVTLYAAFVNAVLAKHKRSRLYDKFAPLPGLSGPSASCVQYRRAGRAAAEGLCRNAME